MRLAHAIIAKSADLMRDGTVAMIGGCIAALGVPRFPFATNFSMIVQIILDPNECGVNHGFQIGKIINPDGIAAESRDTPITPFNVKLETGARFGAFTCISQVVGFAIPNAGAYKFVFHVDGVEVGSLDLDIVHQAPVETVQ